MAPPAEIIDFTNSDDDNTPAYRAPSKTQNVPRTSRTSGSLSNGLNNSEPTRQGTSNRHSSQPQTSKTPSDRVPRPPEQMAHVSHYSKNDPTAQQVPIHKEADRPQNPGTTAQAPIDLEAEPSIPRRMPMGSGNVAKRKYSYAHGSGQLWSAKRPRLADDNSPNDIRAAFGGSPGVGDRYRQPLEPVPRSSRPTICIDLTSPEPGLEDPTGQSIRPKASDPTLQSDQNTSKRLSLESLGPSKVSGERVAESIEPTQSDSQTSRGKLSRRSNARRESKSPGLPLKPKFPLSRSQGVEKTREAIRSSQRRSHENAEQGRRSTIPESPPPSPAAIDQSRKDVTDVQSFGLSSSGGDVRRKQAHKPAAQQAGTSGSGPQPVEAQKAAEFAPLQPSLGPLQPKQSQPILDPSKHGPDGDTTSQPVGWSTPREEQEVRESPAPSKTHISPSGCLSTKQQQSTTPIPGKEAAATGKSKGQSSGLATEMNSGYNARSAPGIPRSSTPARRTGADILHVPGKRSRGLENSRDVAVHAQKMGNVEARNDSGGQTLGEALGQIASPSQSTRGMKITRDKPAELASTPFTNGTGGIPAETTSTTSAMPAMNTLRDAESVIGKTLEAMRSDNEYWARLWLKDARCAAETIVSPQVAKPTSVFSKMPPLALEPVRYTGEGTKRKGRIDSRADFGELVVERANAKKEKVVMRVKCTIVSTDALDVPSYSHYVSIGKNFLGHNDKTLQHWPYFGDDFDMAKAQGLKAQFYIDVDSRPKKLLRLGEAENWAHYAEHMLHQADCSWSDILSFLLEPMPNVGSKRDAQLALKNRDEFCSEDFVRAGRRWKALLSSLPPAKPENLGHAAMLCEQFQRMMKFPIWHLVRRSKYTHQLLRENRQHATLDDLTCRICMRFSCPYHGEINNGSTSSDNMDDEDVVETDIIHPPVISVHERIEFPPSLDDKVLPQTKDPRSFEYWQKAVYANLKHRPDERRPFHPCHHPGVTCDEAGESCSCYRDKVPCEKICGCSPGCARKFQGCSCSSNLGEKRGKGQRLVCYENEKCACFQLCRECDPDLCGDCGVCDVLDPVHKHDDAILEGRCRNASLQRGISKHTVLGDSGVHGLGLYASEDIREHDLVGEYTGEIIMKEEAERRGAVYEHQKLSYLFSLNETQEIDSTYFGGKIRFINHAGKPHGNLYPRISLVNTIPRIGLYGLRSIKAGEEFFFNYGPKFPDEQLGGKAAKKAAPRVRNSDLVHQFWDVEETEDKHGNRRAVKKASAHNENEGAGEGSRARSTRVEGSGLGSLRPRRGVHKSIDRPAKKQSRTVEGEHHDGEADGGANSGKRDAEGDLEMRDAGYRLLDYNIVRGEDDAMDVDQGAADDDDDFDPDEAASEASQDDSESEPDQS